MGGSHSSRKLTVDNENAIQVSQEALDRIQSQLNRKVAEQQAPPPPEYSSYALPPPPLYDEKKLQKNAEEEAYWARRIENLKKAHESISQGMVQEYQRTLKEANELFEMVEKSDYRQLSLCEAEKAKVLECYTKNAHQPLLCSAIVSEFNDCVCKSRISAVSAS